MPGRGRPRPPEGVAGRLVESMEPGREYTNAELATLVGAKTYQVNNAILRLRVHGVKQVRHGVQVYDPDGEMSPTGGWEEVAADSDGFVLRGPNGRLYYARPLSGYPGGR